MDPTMQLCSWTPTEVLPIDTYRSAGYIPVTFDPQSEDNSPPVYCDIPSYYHLQDRKDLFQKYSSSEISEVRTKADPFGTLGRSIFDNRAAVKLANIDAVFQLTSGKSFTFGDIASGPGAFTQYLQYRSGSGWGITLRVPELDWKSSIIDWSRFQAYYGPRGDGDLYTNWRDFVNYVHKQSPRGLDIITGDGGFDSDTSREQEFASSRLLLVQVLVGIHLTKPGGSFVVKVFDTIRVISAQILYLLSCCFNEITLFKPVSSRPANAERYVVCKGRKIDIAQPASILVDASVQNRMLTQIFAEPLPEEFEIWLRRNNQYSIDRQREYTDKMLSLLAGEEVTLDKVNVTRAFILWHIPDGRMVGY